MTTPNHARAGRANTPARLLAPVWSTSDRALAVLAHAAIGFGLVGIGLVASIVISLVIWVVSRVDATSPSTPSRRACISSSC